MPGVYRDRPQYQYGQEDPGNSGKNQILLSRAFYERVKDDVDARPYQPMTVKGKARPLDVYEVVGLKRQ